MNLNLASHHNRLARVGLGEGITKKLIVKIILILTFLRHLFN